MRIHPCIAFVLPLLICGCRLTESSRETLVRSILEHPERIDSIALNNPLSHEYAAGHLRGVSAAKPLEQYFRRVRADYRIEEVEVSRSPEETLVRVLSRRRGIERAQFRFGRDERGWHLKSLSIGHPQFVDGW